MACLKAERPITLLIPFSSYIILPLPIPFPPFLSLNAGNALVVPSVFQVSIAGDNCLPLRSTLSIYFFVAYAIKKENILTENVCIGCQSCLCTADGKWSCNTTSHCRPQDPAIDIDHRVLIMTIENLIGSKYFSKILFLFILIS